MMTWWLVLISRSSRDSATTGLGKSGYQSLGARLLVIFRDRPCVGKNVNAHSVGLAPAEMPLERPPFLLLADAVLHADPRGGLPSARLAPGVVLAQRYFVLRLAWRCLVLVGEVVGQAPVSLVDLRLDLRMQTQLLGDAFGRIAVWSCILPGRSAPDHSRRPEPSLMVAVLAVFCFFLWMAQVTVGRETP